jgi:hypothetical protein
MARRVKAEHRTRATGRREGSVIRRRPSSFFMYCRVAVRRLYTLYSRMDLRSFRLTASVEGHTRCEAGPQSHSS